MVDINLFDDSDEEQQQGAEDPSFEELPDSGGMDIGDDLGGGLEPDDLGQDLGVDMDSDLGGESLDADSLDEAFGFDEDTSAADDLESDTLMGEEDLTDLDEMDAGMDDEDYDFGGGGQTRVSPAIFIIAIIALVVIAWFIKPDLFSSVTSKIGKSKTTTKTMTRKPAGAGVQKPAAQAGQKPSAQATAAGDSGKVPVTVPGSAVPVATNRLIGSSSRVLNDLGGQGQFGMMIIEKDRFMIEYAAANAGNADAFGKRLQTILGAASFNASPEDMHSANGKTVYLGVISGKFAAAAGSSISGSPFRTENDFSNSMKTRIKQQGLQDRGLKKRAAQSQGTVQKVNYEMMLEGDKDKALLFLQQLGQFGGGWEPSKIRISPVDMDDYYAKRVKIVMDLSVLIGQSAPAAGTAM
ncbi:hypothetical protein JW948_11865 [bacterium]|nr:hypothetical protein [bacterium]